MIKSLVLGVLTAMAAASVSGFKPEFHDRPEIVAAGLLSGTSASDADSSVSCDQVSFTRNLRYGEFEQNILDVATVPSKDTASRAVLLIVAGETFTGERGAADASASALQDEAMCFAARHDMVGVRMSYRLAPASPWPAGAQDVAAAASWIHQNID